jgi:ABC-type Fe3+-siderophore transport system permease subunit
VTRIEDLQGIIFWIMGSLDEQNWAFIRIAVAVSLASLAAAYLYCFNLNAFALGEAVARSGQLHKGDIAQLFCAWLVMPRKYAPASSLMYSCVLV